MSTADQVTQILGQVVRHFRHRLRDVKISFWKTRDGEEVDFLVESGGRCYPIEVKLGLPDPRDLAPLARIRDSHWEPGVVVTLARIGAEQPASLHPDWAAIGPHALTFAE